MRQYEITWAERGVRRTAVVQLDDAAVNRHLAAGFTVTPVTPAELVPEHAARPAPDAAARPRPPASARGATRA